MNTPIVDAGIVGYLYGELLEFTCKMKKSKNILMTAG